MPQLLDQKRQERMARIDILSQMGETICLGEFGARPTRIRPTRTPPPQPRQTPIDEDPERWDGLA